MLSLALSVLIAFQDVEAKTKAAEAIQERAAEERSAAVERAVAEFRKVVKDYADTRAYGKCLFNVGYLLATELHRPGEAIAEFRALVDSKVDDREPTGRLMDPFCNYRYRAWRQIESCYDEQSQPGHAIGAVLAARRAYVADCGTCEKQIDERTREALLKLAKGVAKATVEADIDAALLPPPSAGKEKEKPKERDTKVAEPAGGEADAPRFLLALARRHEEQKHGDDALAVLRRLVGEFPESDAGREAARTIEQAEKARGPKEHGK